MSWKTDLRLSDLASDQALEITCKSCGMTRYESPQAIMDRPGLTQTYVDEAERALRCASRYCGGPVRLSLTYDDKTEGFVGGLA